MSYRAGIIGVGGIAGLGILGLHDVDEIGEKKFKASHAGGYESTEGINLETVADVDEEKLSRFGEVWNIPEARRYNDHRKMLAREDLDVVSVCTPSFLHHDHVLDAVESESEPSVIWCEKPIASSIHDGEEMIQACEDNNTELVINHSFRFTESLRKLSDLFREENLLGEVFSVLAQFRMELLRNSTHLLDTVIFLLDSRAKIISGHVTGENEANESLGADITTDDSGGGGFVVTEDGTFLNIDCTVPREPSSMTFQFVGSDGKIYLNNDDGEWRYWSLKNGEHIERSLPGIEGSWSWDVDYRQAFPNAARHIQDLLDGEGENHSSGKDALRSLEIIVGFYLSSYMGSNVTLPFQRPLKDVEIKSW